MSGEVSRFRYSLWLLYGTGLYVGFGSGRKLLQVVRISVAFLLIALGKRSRLAIVFIDRIITEFSRRGSPLHALYRRKGSLQRD